MGCSDGFIRSGQICESCSYECETCSTNTSTCTSCPIDSYRSVLSGGSCIPNCDNGNYYDQFSKKCARCNNECKECVTSSRSQCTQCISGRYLTSIGQGSCAVCGSTCQKCYRSSSTCVVCQSIYSLNEDTWSCSGACNSSFAIVSSYEHAICRRCHPKCKSCSKSV